MLFGFVQTFLEKNLTLILVWIKTNRYNAISNDVLFLSFRPHPSSVSNKLKNLLASLNLFLNSKLIGNTSWSLKLLHLKEVFNILRPFTHFQSLEMLYHKI